MNMSLFRYGAAVKNLQKLFEGKDHFEELIRISLV